MRVFNKTQLDEWLFEHAQIQGHICDGVKGTLQGREPASEVGPTLNVAYIDRETGERFDVVWCPDDANEGEKE